ncbi:STY8, partial [Symbiodinium sp. KB8]
NSSQEPFAKVADFGLSRVDAAETSKQGMTVGVGTWRWMAPEVFASSDDDPEPYNLKADVFSFGILMYEVMERQLPYSERFGNDVSDPRISLHVCMGLRPEVRSSTSEDSPEVREAIRNLMQRAWHNEPDDRPSFPERPLLLFLGVYGNVDPW